MLGALRFRLSGYSRPNFDPDLLCESCGLAWAYGHWFPRRCRSCREIAEARQPAGADSATFERAGRGGQGVGTSSPAPVERTTHQEAQHS